MHVHVHGNTYCPGLRSRGVCGRVKPVVCHQRMDTQEHWRPGRLIHGLVCARGAQAEPGDRRLCADDRAGAWHLPGPLTWTQLVPESAFPAPAKATVQHHGASCVPALRGQQRSTHLLLCKRVRLRGCRLAAAVQVPRQRQVGHQPLRAHHGRRLCKPRPTREALQGLKLSCHLLVAIGNVATGLWRPCSAAGMHCHSSVLLDKNSNASMLHPHGRFTASPVPPSCAQPCT